jgi:succinate dehydrogenase / fumarate reductase membrane anchor subunit
VSTRTPRSRVDGLGAAHSGVGHFWRQRVTAAALVPLALWFAWASVAMIGADRDTALAFLRMPINAVLMGLFIVVATIHMVLGVQVVIEDYIHNEGRKIALLLANQFFAAIVVAASLYALVKIAAG